MTGNISSWASYFTANVALASPGATLLATLTAKGVKAGDLIKVSGWGTLDTDIDAPTEPLLRVIRGTAGTTEGEDAQHQTPAINALLQMRIEVVVNAFQDDPQYSILYGASVTTAGEVMLNGGMGIERVHA